MKFVENIPHRGSCSCLSIAALQRWCKTPLLLTKSRKASSSAAVCGLPDCDLDCQVNGSGLWFAPAPPPTHTLFFLSINRGLSVRCCVVKVTRWTRKSSISQQIMEIRLNLWSVSVHFHYLATWKYVERFVPILIWIHAWSISLLGPVCPLCFLFHVSVTLISQVQIFGSFSTGLYLPTRWVLFLRYETAVLLPACQYLP